MSIISTLLAFAVVILNQFFFSRRTKKERLIEKLEDLAISIEEFYSLGSRLNRELNVDKKLDLESMNTFLMLAGKINTLSQLYFDSIIHSSCNFTVSHKKLEGEIIVIGVDFFVDYPLGTKTRDDYSRYDDSYYGGSETFQLWHIDTMAKIESLIRKHI